MSVDEKRAELAERAAALGLVGRCGSCGELWPACTCGRRRPAPLVEWVRWRRRSGESRHRYGELTLWHVRLTTAGALLCGRRSPPTAPASSSTSPPADACRVCLSKLPELARRSGLS